MVWSRIPDLGSRIQKQQQKSGVKKKIFVLPFYIASKITKLKSINFELVEKKKGQFTKNYRIFDPALLDLEVASAKNVVYFNRNE